MPIAPLFASIDASILYQIQPENFKIGEVSRKKTPEKLPTPWKITAAKFPKGSPHASMENVFFLETSSQAPNSYYISKVM